MYVAIIILIFVFWRMRRIGTEAVYHLSIAGLPTVLEIRLPFCVSLQSRVLPQLRGAPPLIIISYKEGIYKTVAGDPDDKKEVNLLHAASYIATNALTMV